MSNHLLNAIRGLAIVHASGEASPAQPDYYAAALHLGLSEAQAERAELALGRREMTPLERF